ncbi:radical SAM family heme chaperone HemW [Prochlorococcus marinus XMU1411]|uniref:radical SAM family heme chaperone HemW n=1 Tax=Prochlorococcus marinus TaxID=1219 RepID=UPI001ADC4280|nr:radical SAM family heme chaperone HemW [Prochlorococcus marinus]MBO8244314.1 radical SAM family heme chaperone HemW [Prochlorococcus marinus XMU1411]MBW3055399.1 radical SAM protein [Prochlorococcus marinus str. MU1411]MCR8537143.1 radical SAM family heme chaperone HemW [Prochlorococcus marinus CUG1430]
MNKFPRSAYVHIPFCHRRCFYCDFAVIPLGNKVETLQGYGSKTVKEYLHFLYKEILSIKDKSPLSTIYLGGGTPSILDPKQIKEIIDIFKENYGIDYGAEITMEVDPASFNQDDLNGFINAGINRFSLGVQSFNNQILQNAGRRHLREDAEKSCLWLKRVHDSGSIISWSLDLIQNLPLSGFKEWQDDLKKAITFLPPHISIYDLNIENGTVFQKLVNSGKLKLPNDEEAFRNSKLTHLILKNSGYSRYEISNYCFPGHQSRHNRVYWSGLGWWSFGQGSTSSPWGEKLTRPRVSKEYKEWVIRQCELNLDSSLINKDFVYKDLDEKIMLGLRLREGLDIHKVFKEQNWGNKKFESNLRKLLAKWETYLESGLLVRKGYRFFLSNPKGMELSNQILISMFKWWDEIS